jgi:hypothetical protein
MSPRLPALRLCAALCGCALAACGRAASPPSGQSDTTASPGTATSSSGSVGAEDPCSLIEPKAVEALLGGPLAVPPFLSRDGVPKRDGSACEYEDADFHSITVDVSWDHGAIGFKMLGALGAMVDQQAKGLVHLADGTDLAGEWDEARVMGCCGFWALRGDQLIMVDVGGSNATIAGAASLADAALKRLDHRLAINGRGSVQPAIAFEAAHRPKRRDPCALASRGEAEEAIGPMAAEPKPDENRCSYEYVPSRERLSPTYVAYVVQIRWTGGLNEFRNHNAAFGGFSKDLTRNMPISADAKAAIVSSASGADLLANPAWETAHWDLSGLYAVKKDVLVSINPQGGNSDDALKLMVKVMSKL